MNVCSIHKLKEMGLLLLLSLALTACGSSSSPTTTIPVATINVYYGHSAAFNHSSSVSTWGYNGSGQLGNAVTNTSYSPVVPTLNNAAIKAKSLSVGAAHTLAVFSNNTTLAWGANFYGELGNNSTANGVLTPVVVLKTDSNGISPLRNVAAVAAGGNHSLAILNDGTVWSWGNNIYGQLGDNSTVNRIVAAQVKDPLTGSFLAGVTSIAAGGSHSLALINGNVWSWGLSDLGQSGQTVVANSVAAPAIVAGLPSIKLIAAGGSTSVAVDINDKVWVWGLNDFGQMGTPGAAVVPPHLFNKVPQQVGSGIITGSIKAVSAGLGHILVLAQETSGAWTLWGWGFNAYGQLGQFMDATQTTLGNDFKDRYIPVQINKSDLMGTFDPLLTVDGIKPIMAVGRHNLIRTTTGLWAWGDNAYGQLGFTPVTPSYTAVPYKVF